MKSHLLVVIVSLALTGCKGASEAPERIDYGADIVVNYVSKAEAECRPTAAPAIEECAGLPRSETRGRLAAAAALSAYETFQSVCYPDLGAGKCDALIEQAYLEAQSNEKQVLAAGR